MIPAEVADLAVNLRAELSAQGLDAGDRLAPPTAPPDHRVALIRRRLVDLGLVEPNPKKRPRSSYVRFQADLPNEMWQSDFTHWRLATGADTEIITWLDDHSRYALSVTVYRRITGPIVVDTFNQTCAEHGVPRPTDNAMGFSGGKGGRKVPRGEPPSKNGSKPTPAPTTSTTRPPRRMPLQPQPPPPIPRPHHTSRCLHPTTQNRS